MKKFAQWIYLIFFTILPLLFTVSTSELFEFPKFIVLITSSIIIAACYLHDSLVQKDWSLPHLRHPITLGILAVLLTQALATAFSIHPYTSFWGYYSRFHQGLLTTISYTILYLGILKYLDLKFAQKIIKSVIIVGVFLGTLAILEHFNLSISCPFIKGTFTNSCWKETTNPTYRSFATLGQPNWLAAYLIPLTFLLPFYFLSKRQTNPRVSAVPYFFSYCFIFLGLLYTKSRSGYLAISISTIVYLLLILRHSGPKLLAKILPPFIFAIGLSLLIYYLPAWRHDSSASNASTPDTTLTNISTSSSEIRKIVWSGTLKLLQTRPLFGYGPETFAYTYYQVRPVLHNYTTEWDFLYNKAHNEYLNFAANSGIIGLGAYLFFHYVILLNSWRKVKVSKKINQERENYQRIIKPVVGASLTSFVITNFFGFSVISVYALLILVCALPLLPLKKDLPVASASLIPTLLTTAITIFTIVIFPGRLFAADLYYQMGRTNLTNNNLSDAIAALSRARDLRPTEDLYSCYLAEAYASKGELEQALNLINITKKHNDLHQNYIKSRAKSYISLASRDSQFYALASAELEHAATLAPTDPKLFYNLGLLYSRQGRSEKAIEVMLKSLALKNDYYEPYYALTLLYESTKQESLIPPLLQKAKQYLPTIPDPLQAKIEKYRDKL